MKIISTTGALLVEKNIAFDISSSGEMTADNQILSISSSPIPEDMHYILLTKNGKLIKYSIRLERQIDASNFANYEEDDLSIEVNDGE